MLIESRNDHPSDELGVNFDDSLVPTYLIDRFADLVKQYEEGRPIMELL